MVKMTFSARQNRSGKGWLRLDRLASALLVAGLFCAVRMGGFAVDSAFAAANTPRADATLLPPPQAQPTAVPTQDAQTNLVSPAVAEEALVWPWKQENPEPKARLAGAAMNALAAEALEIESHAVTAANNVTSVGQMGGASFRVAVNGAYAYVGTGYKLTVLNIANPAALSVAGKTDSSWADEVLGIDVQGGQAYVAAGTVGLRIVDVTNAALPAEVGFYNTPGYAWDVAVYGNYAYVADGEEGLQIVDVTTAYAPQLKSTLKLPGSAMDVAVDGTYAYVADESEGLRIVNIANPAKPVEAGFVKTQGRAVGLAVANNYVFLAADTAGLRIIDAQTKSAPEEIAAFDTRGNAYAVEVDAAANTAFVADSGEGLRAIDVSDKTAPREAGHFDIAGCWANDVKLSGSYAYLIDTAHGLRVLNATNPGELSQVSLYNSPAPTDVKVINDYAFISAGSAGLRVIHVVDASAPAEVGYFDTPGYAYAVDLVTPPGSSGVFACVADWDKGLRIVDVTTPAAPHEVGALDTPGMARGVTVSWPFAYVADDLMGLQIVSLSDIVHPSIVGVCDQGTCMPAGGSAHGIAVALQSGTNQTFAYVADGDMGLRLIDVSDPTNPAQIGFYDTPGNAQNVALSPSRSYAYVADGFSGGLQIVDISSPNALVSLGAVDTDGSASALNVLRSAENDGDVVFLADGGQGLIVFSVQPLLGGRPQVSAKGFYDTRGWAGSLNVAGKYPYVADGEDGLRILEVPAAWIPYTVSGTVSDPEGDPLIGVRVSADSGASVQTGIDGKYTIKDLLAQSVVVTPSLNGYTFNPGSRTQKLQDSLSDCDFVGSPFIKDGIIGRVVDTDGKTLAGVTIKITPAGSTSEAKGISPVTTDGQGTYTFQGLKKGRYTLSPGMEGYTFSPPAAAFTIPPKAGQEKMADFIGQKIAETAVDAQSIDDRQPRSAVNAAIFPLGGVIRDEQGLPLAGVVISDNAGHQVVTDENGVYLMALPGGSTTLTPAKDGVVFTPPSRQITVGSDMPSLDFSARSSEYTMRGVIRVQGKPLAGVSLSDGSGRVVTTGEDGAFLWNARAGNFILTPAKQGFSFVPEVLRVTFPDVQNAVVEIDAQEGSFTYTGSVHVQDDSPLAGVTIADAFGQTLSGQRGDFTLERPQGTYTFVAEKDGYTIRPDTFDLTFPDPAGGAAIDLLATPLCPNYILNGDFERDGEWSPPSGMAVAYSQDLAYRGARSVTLGPVQGSKPVNGHVNLRQRVIIPKNAQSADLRFMLYLFSENTIDASGDVQQVLILDRNQKDKERILNLHGDDRVWKPYSIDMRKYAGQTIWIVFDVLNDGKGSNLGMYVDDVTLQVCE